MNKEYYVSGTKIIMRRLFKYDINKIIDTYKEYDKLFYNPVTHSFLINVLLYGEIWGAFYDEKLIGCNYFFPLNCDFFKNTNTYSSITDFINKPEKYMYMGYVALNENYYNTKSVNFAQNKKPDSDTMYKSFLNIVQIQAFRQGYKYILHSMPVKMSENISAIFNSDYILLKLRGLDKLIVHYIFVKAVYPETNMYMIDSCSKEIKICLGNTKAISRYLENGHCGVKLERDFNSDNLIIKKLI